MVGWEVPNNEEKDVEYYGQNEADKNNCVEAYYRDICLLKMKECITTDAMTANIG